MGIADGSPSSQRARAPRLADLVIRAVAIYAMTDRQAIYRTIALRDQWFVGVSADPHGLDGLISAETRVVDDPTLTLLPAFYDSHNHLLELARNSLLAPVDQAHSIAEFIEIIRQRAASVPPGQWIRTTTAWNEANLTEGRLPTALELDRATQQHPALVQRGGHTGVANSLALQLAGVTFRARRPRPSGLGMNGPLLSVFVSVCENRCL